MTHNNTSHKSSLLLLELILAILFFSIASAVCVQLFVKSHLLSKQAETLSIAVNECSDAAEIILSANSQSEIFERLASAYPDAVWSDYKNNQFEVEASYDEKSQMTISCSFFYSDSGSSEISAKISFSDRKTDVLIYELEIKHALLDP